MPQACTVDTPMWSQPMYHPANIYTYSTYFLHNTTGENTHAHSNEFWEMVSLMLRNLKGSEKSVI